VTTLTVVGVFLAGLLAGLLSSLLAQRGALRLWVHHHSSLVLLWTRGGVRPSGWMDFPGWTNGQFWLDAMTVMVAGLPVLFSTGASVVAPGELTVSLAALGPAALLSALINLQMWKILEHVAMEGTLLLKDHAGDLAVWKDEAILSRLPAAPPTSPRRRL
jgi:hypothetical protein